MVRRSDARLSEVSVRGQSDFGAVLLGGVQLLLEKIDDRWDELPVAISENERAREQFLTNARDIYVDVIGQVVDFDFPTTTHVEQVARARAGQRIAPASSIRAAELLHNVILESVRELVPATPESSELLLDIASASVAIFLRTMAAAADEHTSALLQEVTQSHASERRRISRELHDQAGSGLAVVHRHLELAQLCLCESDTDSGQVGRSVDIALQGVVETMKNIREILAGLRQDERITSLKSALEAFVATSSTSGRITIDVTGDECRVSEGVRREAFLMMREVLRNAQRHAEASTIALTAEVRPSHLWVRVRDDGVGIDVRTSPGTGMTSLRERAGLLGGRVEWLTPPTGGTTVVITVPLAERSTSIHAGSHPTSGPE
ncbi:sensor histidine kinase [Actinomycetes bacterium M1A6_2h]